MLKSQYYAEITLKPEDNRRLANLCGQFDENLQKIEQYLGIEIHNQGAYFKINGLEKSVKKTVQLLEKLYLETATDQVIDLSKIQLLLQTVSHTPVSLPEDYNNLVIKTKKLKIKPRNLNQFYYLKNMFSYDINFGIGPSGTGKTWLAMAYAISLLELGQVQRLILVRPVVEAGEHLGFLPGDLTQKIDPYLRPLYDALYEMIGADYAQKLLEKNLIELAPLAYMRGRTLTDAFIILDEGQNTTCEQMKMFLTRIGLGSKVVITGDITQIDLPKPIQSGLRQAMTILQDLKEIGFTYFQNQDIVRHPLVQLIVQAYEAAKT